MNKNFKGRSQSVLMKYSKIVSITVCNWPDIFKIWSGNFQRSTVISSSVSIHLYSEISIYIPLVEGFPFELVHTRILIPYFPAKECYCVYEFWPGTYYMSHQNKVHHQSNFYISPKAFLKLLCVIS